MTTVSPTVFTADADGGGPAAHRGFVYTRLLPERGGRRTPGIPMLLWKQGLCSGQWEGGDYDIVRENQSDSGGYLAAC